MASPSRLFLCSILVIFVLLPFTHGAGSSNSTGSGSGAGSTSGNSGSGTSGTGSGATTNNSTGTGAGSGSGTGTGTGATTGPRPKQNFYNPLRQPDAKLPTRQKYLSRTSNAEVWRIQSAVLAQGYSQTSVYFYGNDILVNRVPDADCVGGATKAPCYQATYKNYASSKTKNAFVELATELINRGVVRPNAVKGLVR